MTSAVDTTAARGQVRLRRAFAFLAGCVVVLTLFAAAPPARAEIYSIGLSGGRSDHVESMAIGGAPYFRLADLARAVGASRHWNPRTQKLTLSVGIHRLSMTADSPFVALDGSAINLGRPVVMRRGEYWVPRQFLLDPLALSVNSSVTFDEEGLSITVAKLGASITLISVEDRPENTAAVVWLNDRAEFAVRSRERGRIDVFLPGAVLADSMDVLEETGLVSSVVATAREDGVGVVVRVSPSATSYDAQVHTNPPRLEVTVTSERDDSLPSPSLKGVKDLLAAGPAQPDMFDDGVETVMIDPGHGGTDLGKVGPNGIAEKDVNLALAQELARRLQDEGFYVFMTRSADSYVPLKRRAEIANLAAADVFISIHCGSWHSSAASGFRVSFYVPTGDDTIDRSAAGARGLRRGSHGPGQRGAAELLWGGAQEQMVDDSRTLARAVHRRMASVLSNYDRGVGAADLPVLAGCAMPAILVEPAFISNYSEADALGDAGFRRDAARAIALGVADFRRSARQK